MNHLFADAVSEIIEQRSAGQISTEELDEKIGALMLEIEGLKKEVREINKKLNEIYFAPGMPGCISACERFETMAVKSEPEGWTLKK